MAVSWQIQLDARADDSPWSRLSRRLGGDLRVLALFGVLHLALLAAGLQFREPAQDFTIVWPPVGLLFLALWLAERRYWLWIILIQLATELPLRMLQQGHPAFDSIAAPFLHTANGLVSALVIRRMLGGFQGLRMVAVLKFMVAGAIGAAVAALLWFGIAAATHGVANIAHRALLFFLADLLGALSVVPPFLGWMVAWRFRQLFSLVSVAQRVEIGALLAVQVAVSIYVFSTNGAGGADQLRFPVLVVPGLIYAAFRFPPRWSTLLISTTILMVFWMVVHGGNPLGIERTLERFIWIQVGGATFSIASVSLAVFVAQSHIALAGLAASESRYRSFIELSSEAVWRVELDEPMPVALPLPTQIEWLRRYARVAEHSTSFGPIAGPVQADGRGSWAPEAPWAQVFEANLEQIRQRDYCAGDLQFSATIDGRTRKYLTAFSGVVRNGLLERIWGVARDVTVLLELNASLLHERELLRSYARRITSAEDNTRHSTAVELHNGISQELIAMGMMITAFGNKLAQDQRAPLDELRGHLHKVQQRTRDLISDLSPPGLYDLGLAPALQWLVVYLRSHDRLKVELDSEVDEMAVATELRVLVFKLVRELLRNVVRHAGVEAATVTLRGDRNQLVVTVADEGRGFAWNQDALTSPPRGFGLWSIAIRVAAVGGQLQVDTAPGRGARLTLEIPLRRA